jgi:hypothetical protein
MAIAACLMRWFVCPVPDVEAVGSQAIGAHQHGLTVHVQSPAADDHDLDSCCQLLSDSNAMAAPVILVSGAKAMAPFVLVAIVATVLFATFAPAPLVKLPPVANGPPRRRYQRFATFWSHAPPAERV